MKMAIANNRRSIGERLTRAAALCLLALMSMLLHSREARAQWTTSGTNTTTTNNVGIGTTTPATSLQVTTATANVTRGITDEQTSNDGNSALFTFTKSRAGGAVINGDNIGSLFASAFDGTAFQTPTRLRFFVDGPVAAGSVPTAIQFITGSNGVGAERLRISSSGNVGIGTANPLSQFHLHGSSPRLRISGDATDQHLLIDFHDNNSNESKGIVGYLGANGTGSRYTGIINTGGDYLGLGTTNPTPVYFFIGGAATHIMAANGNVGIGTTAPVSKLHVVGDVTVTGNISAKYQDVAEWVPTLHALPAGTVVILDIAHDNHVMASTKSYDTRVAGVVSAQPGISLGEAGEGKALVATTGRVKVKVDATLGAIHVGDLLVTSDVPGVAMLSKPLDLGGVPIHRPGTLIGKALESLDKGTGEILVLLSLQ
jgi:hypothetical protein